jgi:uncharacterized protein DUF2530
VAGEERVADVQPLDVTGGRTLIVGTAAWVLAFLAMLPFYGTLRDDGNGWWLWTCAAGIGLGFFGIGFCKRREHRLHRRPPTTESSPIGAAGL